MEANQEEKLMTIACSTGKTAPGELVVETFAGSTIAFRAALRGVIGLVVTALMIFVPIAHFVLVPLGLILTLVLVSMAISTKQRILSGSGTCPECGKPVRILTRPYHLPFKDLCESCGRQVIISVT